MARECLSPTGWYGWPSPSSRHPLSIPPVLLRTEASTSAHTRQLQLEAKASSVFLVYERLRLQADRDSELISHRCWILCWLNLTAAKGEVVDTPSSLRDLSRTRHASLYMMALRGDIHCHHLPVEILSLTLPCIWIPHIDSELHLSLEMQTINIHLEITFHV